jgi:hypothetical protein
MHQNLLYLPHPQKQLKIRSWNKNNFLWKEKQMKNCKKNRNLSKDKKKLKEL